MSNLTYTVVDGEFAAGLPAQAAEVLSRFTDIKTFLNSNNLDPTTNLKTNVAYAWTNRHSWIINDTANDNISLVVSGVMAAGKYGLHVSSSAAQVNSALVYFDYTNAASTASILEFSNAGTGSTVKNTQTGNASGFESVCSSSSCTKGTFTANQAGTGPILDATLRSLTSLNPTLLSKVITTPTTLSADATETAVSDLSITLPANFLKVGTTIRGKIRGYIDTPGAAPANAQIKVYYGGIGGVLLLSSGSITPTISLSGSLLDLEFTLTCATIGAAGTIEAEGLLHWNHNSQPVPRGMGIVGTGNSNTSAIVIDTTASKDLVIAWKWSAATVGCVASLRVGHIEILK